MRPASKAAAEGQVAPEKHPAENPVKSIQLFRRIFLSLSIAFNRGLRLSCAGIIRRKNTFELFRSVPSRTFDPSAGDVLAEVEPSEGTSSDDCRNSQRCRRAKRRAELSIGCKRRTTGRPGRGRNYRLQLAARVQTERQREDAAARASRAARTLATNGNHGVD